MIDGWMRSMRRVDEVVQGFRAGRIKLEDAHELLTPQEWVSFRDRPLVDAALIVSVLPGNVDREAVLDLVEHLARLLVDDGAQHALVGVVRLYRMPEHERRYRALALMDSLPEVGDPEVVEEEALEELREMRRQEAAERAALVASVHDDHVAGRIGRREAIERVGLQDWTAICASLHVDMLRRILEDDR